MKRTTISLRKKITILMVVLVLLQSLSLIFALNLSSVFSKLDAESFRLFASTAEARTSTLNQGLNTLMTNLTIETENLKANLLRLSRNYNHPLSAVTMNDDLYAQAAEHAANSTITILDSSAVTGAFVFFNGSNSEKANPDAHSAVYMRNTSPNKTNSAYILEIGPIAAAQKRNISTSIKWSMDLEFNPEEPNTTLFYTEPLRAAQENPRSELQRYGYWSNSIPILPDEQDVICYTLPLICPEGNVYGVFGIEISTAFFSQTYLPATELPYQNSFFTVAHVENDMIPLDWFLPSSPQAQAHLSQSSFLPLIPQKNELVYKTFVSNIGEMYCIPTRLDMYSKNSTFYDNTWVFAALVPEKALHETSRSVFEILLGSIFATTLIAFAAIFVITYLSTRDIAGLSEHVKGLNPNDEIHFKRTGLEEIDDLAIAIEHLSKSLLNSVSVTSKVMDLTTIPMGCYEFVADGQFVYVTEYIYSLLMLETNSSITNEDWQVYYKKLTAFPAAGHDDVYQFMPDASHNSVWLRITNSETETGIIGLVQDISQEIEENMRLAHELDYDSLTKLYNRPAFKREVQAKISGAPNKIGAMMFIDLDNLKYINDTFGHNSGDKLIRRTSALLANFKKYGGIVARISGDEFAIYIHGFLEKDEARHLVKKEIKFIKHQTIVTPNGEDNKIRFSSGLAWYPEDSDNVSDLLKLSDFAMYEVKQQKKGDLFEFNRETYLQKSFLLDNRESINRVLDEGLIEFAFQPIVSLRTGEIFAYEALMRPTAEGYDTPADILAVASSQSKLGQVENMVMQKMFAYVNKHLKVIKEKYIFINSIPSQRISMENFNLFSQEYQKAFPHIVIELTEDEAESDDALNDKLKEFRSLGLKLALDDYGAGHSNQTRILKLAPDIVKIDMGLVQGVSTNVDKRAMIANLILFCTERGILTVAEGIENREDLSEIIDLKVDYAQGNYISRPSFGLEPFVDESVHSTIENYLPKHKKPRIL